MQGFCQLNAHSFSLQQQYQKHNNDEYKPTRLLHLGHWAPVNSVVLWLNQQRNLAALKTPSCEVLQEQLQEHGPTCLLGPWHRIKCQYSKLLTLSLFLIPLSSWRSCLSGLFVGHVDNSNAKLLPSLFIPALSNLFPLMLSTSPYWQFYSISKQNQSLVLLFSIILCFYVFASNWHIGWETCVTSLIWEVQLGRQRLHMPLPRSWWTDNMLIETTVFYTKDKTAEMSLHLFPFTNPKLYHI